MPIIIPMAGRREYKPPKCPKCGCELPEPPPRQRSVVEWVLRIIAAIVLVSMAASLGVGTVMMVLRDRPTYLADQLIQYGMAGLMALVSVVLAFGLGCIAILCPDR